MGKETKGNLNIKPSTDMVALVTKNLNKKGVLKGETKKETKQLRAFCAHHKKSNKKHKDKAMIYTDSNGICSCPACQKSFSSNFKTKDEVKKLNKELDGLFQQTKFASIAVNGDNRMVYSVGKLSLEMKKFFKVYNHTRKIAEKRDKIKKNKKKNNSGNGSNQYGYWSTKR